MLDVDLVRAILLQVESRQVGFNRADFSIEGYEARLVAHHVQTLERLSYFSVERVWRLRGRVIKSFRLMLKGCDFIARSRKECDWQEHKDLFSRRISTELLYRNFEELASEA
jgi:hypothetical protein